MKCDLIPLPSGSAPTRSKIWTRITTRIGDSNIKMDSRPCKRSERKRNGMETRILCSKGSTNISLVRTKIFNFKIDQISIKFDRNRPIRSFRYRCQFRCGGNRHDFSRNHQAFKIGAQSGKTRNVFLDWS